MQKMLEILPENTARMLYDRIAALWKGAPSPREVRAELRSVFEYAVFSLLEGDMRTFGTQYSRIVYLCSKYGMEEELSAAMLAFNRMIAAETEEADELENLRFLTARLLFILHGFSGAEAQDEVLSGFQGKEFSFAINNKTTSSDTLSGVVTGISEIRAENAKRYYVLEFLPEDGLEDFTEPVQVTVAESYPGGYLRRDLMRFRELLKPYSFVRIIGVRAGSSSGLFHTISSSLAVLEPDYLVDVTDIAGCFGADSANPNIFLISRLSPERDSEAMFKGTLINDLLDAYLNDEKASPDRVFRKALSKNLLKAARYGGQAVKRIWDSVLAEHGENIAAFARSLQDQRISVEPSFISALYGMQGRLDVLTEYPDDPLLKNIYELKSGRAPAGTALWRANQIQVACYDMLLTSVYGPQRRGTSALFYSSARQAPLRNFLSSPSDREAIVSLRNEIVSIVYRLAEEDYTPLEALSPERFGECPPYLEETLSTYADFYGNLSPVKKKYYHLFLSFSLREMLAAKTGAFIKAGRDGALGRGYSSLWRDTVERKRDNFAIIDCLEFDWYDKREHLLHFAIREPVEHTMRPGDMVVLYPYADGKGDALKNRIVKGTIRQLDAGHLVFSPRGTQAEIPFFRSFDRWALEHDVMEKGYWAGISGLFPLLSGRSTVSGAVFGALTPQRENFPYHRDDKLTKNQNQAVRDALSARDYFLLQGPPGTGKTSGALMGIVKNILSSSRDNIAVMAFTNRAVAEIAEKLRKGGIEYLRLGHESASGEDKTLSGAAEGLKVNSIRDFIASRRVVLSTVSAYTSRMDDLKDMWRPDVAIVDEASQLTEVQLAGVLCAFRKFILIGDQKQLPAVTVQGESYTQVKDKDLSALSLTDLRGSLFERLWNYSQEKSYAGVRAMLDTHFRMHDDIAALVNPFYGGMLRSGCPRQQEKSLLPRLHFVPSAYEPVFKRHQGEAARVAELLEEIKRRYGKKFTADTVGVVTPWRAQIGVIKSAIDDAEILEKVTIDTVERFQGGEKDIMIVSMAVFNSSQMALLESVDANGEVDRKLNVTLSRAREELILLGYEPALMASPFYARVLDAIRSPEEY